MKFVKSINSIIKKYNPKFSKKKLANKCIIIGSTSSIFDALELKLETYHIVTDPVLQPLDNFFWPTVHISSINKDIWVYSNKKEKKLINY